MSFSEYIVPAVAAAVYLIFLMVRPIMSEKARVYIPLLAGIMGVGLTAWFSMGFGFEIFLQGLASGLAATGIDQAVKIPQYTADTDYGGTGDMR